MIHPSYRELMDKINEENAEESIPGITSRYSVVLATSKRAREITNGAEPLAYAKSGKALSIAVEEFYKGKVRMNPEGHPEEAKEQTAAEETPEGEETAAEETEKAPVEETGETQAEEPAAAEASALEE